MYFNSIMLRRFLSIYFGWLILAISIHYTPSVSANANAHTKSVTVYKFLDESGVLHLTNKPPPDKDKVLYSRSYIVEVYEPPPPPIALDKLTVDTSIPSVDTPISRRDNTVPPKRRPVNDYVALIENVAEQMYLPAALLHAVVKVESNYNPMALSPKGASGLMQLMPATARRYGVTDRTDPRANVTAGASYLKDLLAMFNNDVSLALAAYNAGENAVKRYGNTIPPYRETQAYVKRVKSLYDLYLSVM